MTPEQARAELARRKAEKVQSPAKSPYSFLRGGAEFVGNLGGQALGGTIGSAGGPLGSVAGRVIGGTLGNVAGTMAPDILKQLGKPMTGTPMVPMSPSIDQPSVSPQQLLQSAKEGAISSGLPDVLKGVGKLRRVISPNSGLLRGLSEGAEALTGQSASEFVNLTKKPRAILYRWMGGYKGAQRTWDSFARHAEEKLKIPASMLDFGRKETTASIKRSVDDLMDLPPQAIKALKTHDLIKQIRGISKFMKDPPSGTIGFGEYLGFKRKLLSELEERSAKGGDELATMWRKVGESQLAQSFHTPAFGLLPKAGDEKAAGYKAFYELRRLFPFMVGGGAYAASHNPLLGALGLIMSPMALGAPFAAGGAAVKAANKPAVVTGATKALMELRKMIESE